MEVASLKSQWAALLAESLQRVDRVPAGWKTALEIAAESGMSRPYAARKIRDLIAAKRVVKKQFRVKLRKQVRPTWHYKIAMSCTPEDFDPEADPAVSPQEQIGQRKNVGARKQKIRVKEAVSLSKSRVPKPDESDRAIRTRKVR